MTNLRYAFRRLAKVPGFTLVAIVTLALGIGASTAIFSVVNGVLLQPLAFRDHAQLVWLREFCPVWTQNTLPVNAYHFLAWRDRAKSFQGVTVVDPYSATVTGRGAPEQVSVVGVSANFFSVLGVGPNLGRSFAPEEETAGRHRVVVLGHSYWARAYNSDPTVVGRVIQVDKEPYTVIGVLPENFRFPQVSGRNMGWSGVARPDLFAPKIFEPGELGEKLGRHNYGAIARLKPDVGLAQAESDLNGIANQIVEESGEKGFVLRSAVFPLQEAIVGESRRGLLVLFGAVVAVLLIGCLNLANFLLAQAERRKHEAALRQALGATRAQLVRQALTETLLVSCSGGVLGILFAYGGIAVLLRHAPASLPRLDSVHIDPGVLGFALGLSLLSGLAVGLIPAFRLARSQPQAALASGSRSIAGGRGRRFSDAIVAIEVGLSLVLLSAAALLGGSFAKLLRADQGYNASTVLTAKLGIPESVYPSPAARAGFFEKIVEQLIRTPGITSAAVTSVLPLQGNRWIDKAYPVGDTRPEAERPNVNTRFVSGRYFETLGIPLHAGRTFTDLDREHRVILISESLAQLLWPGQDPIGRMVERNPGEKPFQVVGVVGDTRTESDQSLTPIVYRPYWDWPFLGMTVAVRAAGDPRAAAGAIRAARDSVDRDVPITELQTMDDLFDTSVATHRFQMLLAAVFGTTALLLTALGIYGVVAYSVTRRTREIGVRMAFGANPSAVAALIIRQGMRPVLLGLVLGTAASVAGGQIIASLLYETRSGDPAILGGVCGGLALIALIACYLPGRGATRVDPLEALRSD